jgi:hypothetical protein
MLLDHHLSGLWPGARLLIAYLTFILYGGYFVYWVQGPHPWVNLWVASYVEGLGGPLGFMLFCLVGGVLFVLWLREKEED